MSELQVPRPGGEEHALSSYRVLARNRRGLKDWDELVRQREERCRECWDHISSRPRETIGKRYGPLQGTLSQASYGGESLPQWQYEIDRRARVKVLIGADFVVITGASTGHARENE